MLDDTCLETAVLSDALPDIPIETKSAADGAIASGDTDQAAQTRRPRRYRAKRTTSDRVREALLELAEGRANLLTHEESSWNSITFSGTRHEVMLDFDGPSAASAGERFIAALPDHEFTIPGQLVADATIREVDHRFGVEERLVVTAVMLLLEDR